MTKPFITEIQSEGTHIERATERRDSLEQAHKLVSNLPDTRLHAQRQAYIRSLVVKALRREIDPEVFEAFVTLTNVQDEVEAVLARARMTAK